MLYVLKFREMFWESMRRKKKNFLRVVEAPPLNLIYGVCPKSYGLSLVVMDFKTQ